MSKSEEKLHWLLVITAWSIQTIYVHVIITGQWLESISACSRTMELTWGFQKVPGLGFCLRASFNYLLIDALKEKVLKDANGNFLEAKIPWSPTHRFSGYLRGCLFLHQPAETRHGKSSLPVSLHYPSPFRGLVVVGISKCFKIPDERCCRNARTLCIFIERSYSQAPAAHLEC